MGDYVTTPYANSLFEQPWWLDIVAPGMWREAIVKEGNEVIARLPYCYTKEKIFMPPLTQTLGPWIKPEFRMQMRGNTQLSKQKEIVSRLLEQLPQFKSFNMHLDSVNDYVLPYRWKGFRYEPSFSYRIRDLQDIEKVHSNIHKQVQKNINKYEKESIVSYENDANVLIDLMNKTFSAQNRKNPIDNCLIKKIVDVCSSRNNGQMFIAKDRDFNIQVCAFLVYDERCAYALLSGSNPEYRGSGSKSLIYWREIEYAQKYTNQFDFEGSNIEGIENIIRQFGGDRIVYYHIIKQSYLHDCIDLIKPRIKKTIGYKI